MIETTNGVRIVHHGGNNMGFTSDMFFLPEHGVGVVVLTNTGDANALRRMVRRRILELLFEGNEEASRSLEVSLGAKADRAKIEQAKVTEIDAAWLGQWAGAYTNASLGTLKLRMNGKRGELDAGEWKSAVGKKTESGKTMLVLLEPPFAGFEVEAIDDKGRRTLTVQEGQHAYEFAPAAK